MRDKTMSDIGKEVLRQLDRIECETRKIAKAIGVTPGEVSEIETESTELDQGEVVREQARTQRWRRQKVKR